MPERLLVVVGAGASMMVGAPSTWGVTNAVRQLTQGTTIPVPAPSFQTDRVLEHVFQVLDGSYESPNFETMLHAIEVASGLVSGWRAGTVDRFRPVESVLCGGPRGGPTASLFNQLALIDAARTMFRSLHDQFTQASANGPAHAEWPDWKSFWEHLDNEFEVDVATLNYDTLLEQALPGRLDEGFRAEPSVIGERFNPVEFANARARLMHLHGSIHYGYPDLGGNPNRFIFEDEHDDLYRHGAPADALASLNPRSGNVSQAGRPAEIGPMITGLDKTAKVVIAEPYRTYMHTLHSLVEQVPRLLIVGYGFGDLHVNSAIGRFTRLHGDSRRVAVVDFWNPWEHYSVWAQTRYELFKGVARFSQEAAPMDTLTDPVLWRSSDARCMVATKGLGDVAKNHTADVVAHLAS